MPLEIAHLRGSQSMAIRDQDHGRVSMSVAAVLAGIGHELFDLASGQVFSNCTVYSGWWAGIPSLIPHRKFRCRADPPRGAASIVMLGACRRHLARLALPQADARKAPLV